MNPTPFIPAADVLPLPAPVWLLAALLHLTFLLHLVAMNALLGGVLVTLWARWRGGDAWRGLADAVTPVLPTLVAGTVTLGVAPLLFVQVLFGQFLFTSSILMGWSWFSVVPVLILAYYGTYLQSFRGPRLGAARLPLLALTALFFVWVSFVYSNNMTLMLNTGAWPGLYFADAGGRHLNLGDVSLWPRWLHLVTGAVAVAGLLLAWWGRGRLRGGNPDGRFLARTGWHLWTWGTGLNLVLGLLYFVVLERPVRKLFMGGSVLGTGLLTAGLLLGIVLLVRGVRGRARAAEAAPGLDTALLALTLVVMVLMRDLVRRGSLAGLYRPAEFPVQPQLLNLALFAVLLLGGAALLIWMVRRLALAWGR